jgi:glycosyltransferase involved in cell wall biosynthesis
MAAGMLMIFSGVRVALVGPIAPPAGGMASLTQQLVELLSADQAQVTLVPTNAPYRPAWIGKLPAVRAVFRLVPYIWALWSALQKCNVIHIMANSGWSWHLFATPAIWIAKLRGVPIVVNYHGGEAEVFLTKSKHLVQFSMRQVACLIVPSSFLQHVFVRFGMQATIVPNIIDIVRFRPREARCKFSAHLMVARNLEPLYDNATALRAFQVVQARRPDARMTIAGSGSEGPILLQLAKDLGVSNAVSFTGRLDRDAMAALFRSADIVLNPSLADNMPGSVLESLSSGVPVVSTNVGGVPCIVQDGFTALLVPPADPCAMAAACLKVLADEDLWHRLSEAGLAEVQRYTWDHVAPLLAGVYHLAIAQGRQKTLGAP